MSCYYIIIFYLYTYTLQEDFNIYGQVISYGNMLSKGTYFFPITINSDYCASSSYKANNTILSLRKIINGNGNLKFHDSNDVFPYYLMTIYHKIISVHLH